MNEKGIKKRNNFFDRNGKIKGKIYFLKWNNE